MINTHDICIDCAAYCFGCSGIDPDENVPETPACFEPFPIDDGEDLGHV